MRVWKKGDRVVAYSWDGLRLGRGTITWVGPHEYVRVEMDTTGKRLAIRKDKLGRLISGRVR